MNRISTNEQTGPSTLSAELSVGIPEIDEEHHQFFANIENLVEALALRKDVAEIRRLMHVIVDDAIEHFKHEEKLFIQFGYPHIDKHVEQHSTLTARLLLLKERIDAADIHTELIDIGEKIKTWLMGHLLEQDMQYRDFLHKYKLLPI